MFILSPNMNLPIPTVGQEPGPQYAFDVNNALTLLDSHDHTPGKGVKITPAAININVDLTFNSNSATGLLNAVFVSQSTATATLQALSVAPGTETPTPIQDLWYTDSAGNKVQITANGALAAVSTTVSGISYSSGTFAFRQTPDSLPLNPANLDAGDLVLRPNVAINSGTPKITLSVPSGISTQYGIQLPTPPGAPSFMQLDSSGNMSASIAVSAGLTGSNIAAATITGSNIANNTVASSNLTNNTRQLRSQIFTSSGTFTFPAATTTSTQYKVTVVAGGGGGGCGNMGAGGGGAGGTSISYLTGFTPSSTQTVTVGSGGLGAGTNNTTGQAGFTSSFGSSTIAAGGGGGITNGTQFRGGAGGSPGTATSGFAYAGGSGTAGFVGNANIDWGNGGNSSAGGGGLGGNPGLSLSAGNPGGGYGAGGGGGAFPAAGGNGAAGIVIVEWIQ